MYVLLPSRKGDLPIGPFTSQRDAADYMQVLSAQGEDATCLYRIRALGEVNYTDLYQWRLEASAFYHGTGPFEDA